MHVVTSTHTRCQLLSYTWHYWRVYIQLLGRAANSPLFWEFLQEFWHCGIFPKPLRFSPYFHAAYLTTVTCSPKWYFLFRFFRIKLCTHIAFSHCLLNVAVRFLGAFAKLRKATVSFMSFRPSIRPRGTTQHVLNGVWWYSMLEILFEPFFFLLENVSRKFKLW
jgi:hypothetical protein